MSRPSRSLIFSVELAKKFGAIHVSLYIHLGPFTDYYLAMLASEDALKWALVNVQDTVHESFRMRSIVDFGWLDTDQIGGARSKQRQQRWDDLLHSTDQDFISRLPADTHQSVSVPAIWRHSERLL